MNEVPQHIPWRLAERHRPWRVLVRLILFLLLVTPGSTQAATEPFPPFTPPTWLLWLLRLAGSLLVMYALFARPGEPQRHENYLTEWWVRIEQRREAALRWPAALLQVVAGITTTIFDRWFGSRLLSVQAVIVSVTISLLTYNLVVSMNILRNVRIGWKWYYYVDIQPSMWNILAACAFTALLALLYHFVCPFSLAIVGGAILLYCFLPLILSSHEVTGYPPVLRDLVRANINVIIALAGVISVFWSLLCDIVFIASSRYLVRKAVGLTSVLRISVLVSGTLLGGLALVCLPIVLFLIADHYGPANVSFLWPIVLPSSMMNLSDLFVAGLFLLIALAMVTHRLIWTLIGRPLEVFVAEHVLLKRGHSCLLASRHSVRHRLL